MKFKAFHIIHLADCPETIPTLARWFYEEWGHLVPERTIEQNEDQLRQRINRCKVPLTLVAFSGQQPVGSASLKIQEMDTHKHLIHWLGNVYVLPEYRNRGIGSALVRRAEEEATRLSVEELYLHTPDKENMYSRLGWTVIERTHYRGLDVAIMKRQLSVKPEHGGSSQDHSISGNEKQMAAQHVEYRINPLVTNEELNALLADAWPDHEIRDFAPILDRSLGYVCAYQGDRLVGFVNVAWDGAKHAFLLDTTVRSDLQRSGIGLELVGRAKALARKSGAEWLHVDFEASLGEFYRKCGFLKTEAGLIKLTE